MTDEDRFRPSLHDPDFGIPAAAGWVERRLARGHSVSLVAYNQGMDPGVMDGDTVELSAVDPSVPFRPGEVLLVSAQEGLRLLRLGRVREDTLLAKADCESEEMEVPRCAGRQNCY